MTEEEQRQEVAVWGENMNLMKSSRLYGISQKCGGRYMGRIYGA